MANKSLQQANKLVSKATLVFGEAITSIEKANEILEKGITQDELEIEKTHNEIAKLEIRLGELKKDKEDKVHQIENNNGLIEQLKTFAPQN